MYRGNNPSALRSQKMIVAAMFELLGEIPYAKINVKRLTDQAQVSRQTFYAMFSSREEVIQYRLQDIFVEYQAALASQPFTLHSLVSLFFEFYQKHDQLFNQLIDNGLANVLTTNARDCMMALHLVNSPTERYVNGFMAAGLTQMLCDWHTQADISLTALVAATEALLNPATISAQPPLQ